MTTGGNRGAQTCWSGLRVKDNGFIKVTLGEKKRLASECPEKMAASKKKKKKKKNEKERIQGYCIVL